MEEQLNCELNACLLRCVINASNENDYDTLQEMGLSSDLVERAKTMNADVFSRLSNFNIATVTFDARRFGFMLDFVEHERVMSNLVNKMIGLEASQSMLHSLVGINPTEYRNRRKTLGLPPPTQGRPHSLDTQQTDRLYETLSKHPEPENANTNDLLHWYCLLGKETGLPLTQIWHQNMKFG